MFDWIDKDIYRTDEMLQESPLTLGTAPYYDRFNMTSGDILAFRPNQKQNSNERVWFAQFVDRTKLNVKIHWLTLFVKKNGERFYEIGSKLTLLRIGSVVQVLNSTEHRLDEGKVVINRRTYKRCASLT